MEMKKCNTDTDLAYAYRVVAHYSYEKEAH